MGYDNRQRDKVRSMQRRQDRRRKFEARQIDDTAPDNVVSMDSVRDRPIKAAASRSEAIVRPCPVAYLKAA